MNPDLYTEEFRNFKYLKSTQLAVSYFKKNAATIQKVQPWTQINDHNFVWETRLEFLEQLFDLRQEIVYFVIPAELNNANSEYRYEDSRMYEIRKPFIYKGKAIQMDQEACLDDIFSIEENPGGFYLSTDGGDLGDKIFLTMQQCPLIPGIFPSYAAMFYNRDWALKYKDAITYFLRKNVDAITSIAHSF